MSVSGASASSYGSSSAGSEVVGGPQNGEEGLEENNASLESGLFGVLFTVGKEKAYSAPFVAFRLFMDWIQVFLLLVNPAYGWNIDPNNKLWQAFNFIQLNYFMSVRGYTFFLICMYILAVALAANLGLCLWVAHSFKNNSFNHVWPIVWLRYFSLVFYQVLDVASVTLFLMTMDCQYFSVEKDVQGYNQEFSGVYCWEMPHMIHVAVAAVSIALFFVLASVFTMAEIELNPVSKSLIGMAHTKVEVWGLAVRMFMTCTSVFITGLRWMSVFQLISSFFLCYLYLKWLPHLHAIINHIRVGSYFSIFWAALLLTIMAYNPGLDIHDDAGKAKQAKAISIVLWALFIPVGLAGAALSWWRTRYFTVEVVGKFRDAPPETKARDIHEFTDPREVEIAGRCCRQWLDKDTLDQDGVRLAERIIKAGVCQLPQEPYMVIWWSSFLIDVQGSYQSGYAELQNAKKMPNPSFLERFCIFIREQEHTQKASAATSGDNANVDLVSYVEFQRNYRLALHLHLEALIAKRTFWETLLHHNVTFNKVARAVERIETTVRASERMYKQVLARHSNSVKIVSLYVKFLQGVRNDPWSAARWGAEVEKMQRVEEEANERAVFGNGDASALSNHDNSKGVIIMGANCLIRMINEPAANMLGYVNKSELVGKNINIIVPPPFARNHNNYVRNYIQTGQARILNVMREFVALHRDRYVIPIDVYVTKVSGVGEDSVFMGIFSLVPPEPDTAKLWVLSSGSILSCDSELTDWLGYKHEDIHGKPMSHMAVVKSEIEELLTRVKADVALGKKDDGVRKGTCTQKWNAKGIQMKHLYLDHVTTLDISAQVGGIGETAMFVFRMHRDNATTPPLLISDAKGRITHVTSTLATRLGTTTSKLQAGGMMHALDFVLPPAFARMHHTWYRDKPEVPPAWSCRSGMTVCLNATNADGPCIVPFSMRFKRKEVPHREAVNIVMLEERTMDQMLDERRLLLTLNSKGVIVNAGNSPKTLFGFEPAALVGSHLSAILDILHAGDGDAQGMQTRANDDMATRVLMLMAERNYRMPGMSWRVGVAPIIDPDALRALGPMGAAMIADQTVPAVLVVEGYMEKLVVQGAQAILPAEMQLKVQLWRSDLLSGVMELDTQGNVAALGLKEQPGLSPHLLLGLPPSLLTSAAFSQIVPLGGKPVLEALFTEGALSTAPRGGAGGRGPGAGGRGLRGGLRGGSQYSRRRGCGPFHVIKLPHATDGADLEISLQAVVKQDMGTGCTLYITMHVVSPTNGRPDFWRWVWDAPPPALHVRHFKRNSVERGQNGVIVGGVLPGRSGRGPSFLLPGNASFMVSGTSGINGGSFLAPSIATGMLPCPPSDPAAPHAHLKPGHRETKEAVRVSPGSAFMRNEGPPTPPLDGDGDDEPVGPVAAKALAARGSNLLADLSDRDSSESNSDEEKKVMMKAVPPMKGPPGVLTRKASGGVARRGSGQVETDGRDSKTDGRGKGKAAPAVNVARKKAPESAPKARAKASHAGQSDDDADSVNSDTPGLKDGGHERIATWMSNIQEQSGTEGVEEADELGSEEEEEESEAEREDAQENVVDMEEEQEAGELDEAGSAMNDYKRGKRLRKLSKILQSPAAQGPNMRLKWVSIVIVLVLVVVDLCMFITFMTLSKVQSEEVLDLRSSSRAVNRVMRVAMSCASLGILLSGLGTSRIEHLGRPSTAESIEYHINAMVTRTNDLETYHHGIYRGFNGLRQLPNAFNLREIWEHPHLNVRMFYNGTNGTFASYQRMSLWDAGNYMVKAARSIVQTIGPKYIDVGASAAFVNNTDYLFILYNAPRSIMESYQETLDGMMQQAIKDSQKMNGIQLVILAVEGGFVGVTSVIIIWVITSQVVMRRHAIFNIFMMVPTGVLRGLATVAFNLEEGAEDEETQEGGQEELDQGDALGPGGGSSGHGGTGGGGAHGVSLDPETGGGGGRNRVATSMMGKLHMAAKPADEADVPRSFWARLKSTIMFWRPAPAAARRHLAPSWTAVMWIAWPFMFWAAFVVVINIIGYMKLKDMSEPISISNVVQFMSIRANRVLLFATRLASGQYFDNTYSFTDVQFPAGVVNPHKAQYRATLSTDYAALRLEYDAMLYGQADADVQKQTTPHFTLLKSGIVFTPGAELMYSTTGCMSQDPTECQPEDSPFFPLTNYGLDQMLKAFFMAIENLLLLDDDSTNMQTGGFFEYIYEVGNADLYGGLILLTDVYTHAVERAYTDALDLHIIAFVMCCGLGAVYLAFIMRPTHIRNTQESRRVAELLSCLPPEINTEVLVQEALSVRDPAGQAAREAQVAAGEDNVFKGARSSGSITEGNDKRGMEKSFTGVGRGSMDNMTRPKM